MKAKYNNIRHFLGKHKIRLKLLVLTTFIFVAIFSFSNNNVHIVSAATLDSSDITTTLGSYTAGAATTVTIVLTEASMTNLVATDTITVYLAGVSGGDTNWQLNSVTTADIGCTQVGGTYSGNAVAAASVSLPMKIVYDVDSWGDGADITCTIGDASPDPMNPVDAGGYSVAVVTSQDSGAGIVYVGDGNDVTVTATVLPLLSLTLSNGADTCTTTAGGVTSCNLGVLYTTAVNTGNYRVQALTNATVDDGLSVLVQSDGLLRNGAVNIDDVTDDDVTAGSEEYGGEAVTTGSDVELTAPWNGGAGAEFDIPNGAPEEVFSDVAGPVGSASYITFTHSAAIDATVPSLEYTQVVTWTATADF